MLTWKQRIIKSLYPLIMFLAGKDKQKGQRLVNKKTILPKQSFYELQAVAANGQAIGMSQYKGKKIVIVNVASNCGFTGQYDELEKLYKQNSDRLVVLGFPANDFRDQEPGDDAQIQQFCSVNFGVTFPLFKKHLVSKPNQNPVYQWLSDASLNGWNDQQPTWNFCKYVLDEQGILKGYFGSAVGISDPEFQALLR
jgi:glutathione peroxidase